LALSKKMKPCFATHGWMTSFPAGFLMLVWIALFPLLLTAETGPEEYKVKTAFIYNFAKFIEWPPEALDGRQELLVGVLGQNPFGSDLKSLESKMIGGRPVRVRYYSEIKEADGCHILFIAASEREHIPAILEFVRGRHVVTIGESDEFVAKGGIINFFLQANRVRFEINGQAAEKEGLKISSQLMRLSKPWTAADAR
jgi:hypothetical protein